MLKVLFFFFVLVDLGLLVQAQESTAQLDSLHSKESLGIRWAPVLGISTFKSVGQSNSDRISTTNGGVAGVLVDTDYFNSSFFVFQTGILLIQEGDTVSSTEFQRTNDYLAFPLINKAIFYRDAVASWYVPVGLVPCYLIGANTNKNGTVKDSKAATQDYDFQGTIGLGTTYKIKPNLEIMTSFSMMRGLIGFLKSGGPIFNQGYILNAGMMF